MTFELSPEDVDELRHLLARERAACASAAAELQRERGPGAAAGVRQATSRWDRIGGWLARAEPGAHQLTFRVFALPPEGAS